MFNEPVDHTVFFADKEYADKTTAQCKHLLQQSSAGLTSTVKETKDIWEGSVATTYALCYAVR